MAKAKKSSSVPGQKSDAQLYINAVTQEVTKAATSQRKAIPGRENDMVKNNAGGVTFKLDMWDRVDRFLILGSEKSMYNGRAELTRENAKNLVECIKIDGKRVVDMIVAVSDQGRAPKNDPAVFALALCASSGNPEVSAYAFENLGKVCRIGTHLFNFTATFNALGKWRGVAKRGIANWYARPAEKLAYQLLKYQQRNGWSHRDVIRLAHVRPKTQEHNALFHWVTKDHAHMEGVKMPEIVYAFEALHKDPTVANARKAIEDYGLSWEMLPTQLLKTKEIWEALIPTMGLTALIRNLGRMSAIGMTNALSDAEKAIVERLSDAQALQAARIHPVNVLSAMKTYNAGQGERGSLTWKANKRIVDALDDAFYDCFKYVEPSGENYMMGIDCSGSMWMGQVIGLPNLKAAEVAACMALAVAKTESSYWFGGFNTTMSELNISPNMRLDTVLKVMRGFDWGGTDCAQPMLYALKNKMNVDKFCVYTDNETWAGRIQPVQALQQYRDTYGKGKLIVCGTQSNGFTIADPNDRGMLDLVGFDSAAPQLISQF